jgi:glycosyltransferase involved in cell wall biosynthesis
MISVIIPTYNEEGNIERCLRSLERQTIPRSRFEVIVVDGQSRDHTVEIAERYADRVIQQVSKGVGGARNDGARIARGRVIVNTDADCLPPPNWLESIMRCFEDERVLAATGLLKPVLGDLDDDERAAYNVLFEISNIFVLIAAKLGFYHLCGANTAFNRDVFNKVGGYSDLPYSDDIEIVRRLKPLGRIAVSKDIWVNYSIRRIRKLGLVKYAFTIFRNDWAVMFFNHRPVKGDYARQDYH